MHRLLVLASGRGSNFSAIAEAINDGTLPNCEIVSLICNNPSAKAITIAQEKGVPVKILDSKTFPNRQAYDDALGLAVSGFSPDLICLAGYMKLLNKKFVDDWKDKIVNIHPSLLPSFPGLQAQKQAFEHGARWTGCTVHLVTPEMDDGPILAQSVIEITPEDTVDSLSERLLTVEHKTYVEALKRMISTPYRIEDGKVVWEVSQPKK